MVNFLGKKWSLSVSRNAHLFQAAADVSSQFIYAKEFGVVPKESIIIVKNGLQFFILGNEDNNKKYLKSVESICLNPSKLRKLKATYLKLGRALLKASLQFEKEISLKSFKSYFSAYMKLNPGLVLTTMLGRHMQELLEDQLSELYKNISKAELNILVSDITYPDKHTPLLDSQVSLLEIGAELQKRKIKAKDIKKYPSIYKKLKNYIKKYSAIPVNFTEDPWTEEDIMGQLESLMKSNCRAEKERIAAQHKRRIKKSKEALCKIENKEIKNMANSLKVGVFLNEYRKYVICTASAAQRPFFKKIAERYNLSSWKECWKLTPHELMDLYFNDKKEILGVLPERKLVGTIFSHNEPRYRLLSKRELSQLMPEIERVMPSEDKTGDIREIKGTIANPGVTKGVAKVILGSFDFHKFQDGDIIVTTMTSVDFIPIMKRASAFVTNEGGITCHASIVSRELDKPCIIGTKNAAKVLKDGDLVEVDADKGIVKILKK